LVRVITLPLGENNALTGLLLEHDRGGDLSDFAQWMCDRQDWVLGIDTETNALNPWDPDFRVRLIQISDGQLVWMCQPNHYVAQLIRDHRRFVAHFSEAEIRFLGRDPIMRGCVRMEDDAPHIMDTQPVLGHYDPATLLPANEDKIDPRLRHARGLKETYAREFSPVLRHYETALHGWFLANAPKGFRTKKKALSWGFANVPVKTLEYLQYGGMDAVGCKRLWDKMFVSQRVQARMSHARRDVTVQWDCDRMTFRGLPVDPPYVRWLHDQLREVIQVNTRRLEQHGIAPSGQGQTVAKAFAVLGIPPFKMTAARPAQYNDAGEMTRAAKEPSPSWDKDALTQLDDLDISGLHIEGDLMRWSAAKRLGALLTQSRRATKFDGTYVAPMLEALERDGRVHCSFRAVGTVTHRMSAQEPPLQQQPKKDTRVRAAFGGVPGWVFVSADFNQGEPRTMAALSGDPNYVAAVLTGDVNSAAAAAAFGAQFNPAEGKVAGTRSYMFRQAAKVGFLSVCYKAGVRTLAKGMHISQQSAAGVRNNWHHEYAVMFGRANRMDQQEFVVLPTGREIILWDRKVWVDGRVITRSEPSRKALNYETQGTQRDYLVAAWMKLRPKWQHFLAFFLHDEIVLFVPENLAEEARADLADAMTMYLGNGVTMECEATIDGPTWLPQPREFDERELIAVDDVPEYQYA
jgi:DNA polymerase family A